MTSPTLTVALLQSDLYWESPTANLAMFEEKIAQIGQQVDLILLPEMFTTGFSMNAAALAEHTGLHTFKWLRQQAAQTGAVVAGSYMVQAEGRYFNRLLWMRPDGSFEHYDKRHLFRMAGEHQAYTPGKRHLVATLKGWRICPMICYDLRFPVWSRQTEALNYDVLVYLANWPLPRNHAWNTLLRARAIENLAYCIGVNRTGTDGAGKSYTGESAVIDYLGEALFYQKDQPCTAICTLNYEELQAFRAKFPVYLDADRFGLNP